MLHLFGWNMKTNETELRELTVWLLWKFENLKTSWSVLIHKKLKQIGWIMKKNYIEYVRFYYGYEYARIFLSEFLRLSQLVLITIAAVWKPIFTFVFLRHGRGTLKVFGTSKGYHRTNAFCRLSWLRWCTLKG